MLLHGVTGSGKTEVYLRAAAEVLAQGRGVLILVPEISLTGQTIAPRARAASPTQRVAVLHSSLSAGERLAAYRAAGGGRARIVIGARSAIFAPIADLGLIVVDEEHDASYKQESEPRYDARTVARWRAQLSGAALVFGSATPRLETWADAPIARRPAAACGRLAAAAPGGRRPARHPQRPLGAAARRPAGLRGGAARRPSSSSTGAASPPPSPAATAATRGSARAATSR